MKVGIILKGKLASVEPIEIGKDTLAKVRTAIDGLALKGAPKEWRFFRKDDELPRESEATIVASTMVVDGNLSIGPAKATVAKPAAKTAAKTVTKTAAAKTATSKTAAAAATTTSAAKPAATPSDPVGKPATKAATVKSPPRTIDRTLLPDRPKDPDLKLPDDGMPALQKVFEAATNLTSGTSSTADLTTGVVLETAYKRGNFPHTLRYDETLSSRAGAVRLEVPAEDTATLDELKSLAKELTVTLKTHAFFDSRAFERELYSKLFTSSAFTLAVAGSGSAVVEGVTVSARNSAQMETTSSKSEVKRSRTLYVSSFRRVERADISVPRSLVRVSNEVEARLKTAIDAHDRSPDADFSAIFEALAIHGALVPLTYTLGGEVFTYEEQSSTDLLSTVSTQTRTAFSHEVDAALEGVASAGTTTTARNSSGEDETHRDASRLARYALQQVGGDVGFARDPGKWIESLARPGNWDVISVADPVPVWEFFGEEHRRRWRAMAPQLRTWLERKMSVEEAKLGRLRDLVSAQLAGVAAAKGSVENNNVRRTLGIENVPGAITADPVPVAADWGYLGRTRETSLPVPPGYVITYVRIFTAYDPPGTYLITKGGVLSGDMAFRFEQENMRGMSWHVDYQFARPEDINVSPMYGAMNALYRAL